MEYLFDLFIPLSGKRSGASFIVNLALLFAPVWHFSWVPFEHLALIFKHRQVQGAGVSPGAVAVEREVAGAGVALLGVGVTGEGGVEFVGSPADDSVKATQRSSTPG